MISTNSSAAFVSTSVLSDVVKAECIKLDMRLLNNRKVIETAAIKAQGLSAYDERSAFIAMNKKYETVEAALVSLYDIGIQHTCNLADLLANYNVVVGSAI